LAEVRVKGKKEGRDHGDGVKLKRAEWRTSGRVTKNREGRCREASQAQE
jgi:hypothetical protein